MVGLLAIALGLYLWEVRALLMGVILPEDASISGLIPSDALYYVSIASEYTLKDILTLDRYNIIGPVLFIWLMGGNLDLLILANVIGLIMALRGLNRYTEVRIARFAVLLLANPLVLLNLITPNKEITAILAVLFTVVYIQSGRSIYALVAIGFAALSKLEILALLLFFMCIRRLRLGKNRTGRLFLFVGLLMLASLIYAILGDTGRAQALIEGQTINSTGIAVMLHTLAVHYFLFAMVMIPRLALVVFEGAINLVRGDPVAIGILLPIFSSGIFIVIAGLVAVFRSRLRLADDKVFLLLLIITMVAYVPFPHHRYLLPAYPLLLFLALNPRRPRSATVINRSSGPTKALKMQT